MAVVQPDTMSVILAITLHGVVAEVTLGHFLVRVDHNLSKRDNSQRQGGNILHASKKVNQR